MSQYLPTGDFRELDLLNKISLLISFLRTPDINEDGLLRECDLDYPSRIHGETKHFPFLPEKKTL